MKLAIQGLEAEKKENAEFRALMINWMRESKGKLREDSSSSTLHDGVRLEDTPLTTGGPTGRLMGENRHHDGLPWAVKKIKLPEFQGFDPQGWIQKASLYFDINQTPPHLRVRLAQLSMVGVAQHWFTIVQQVHENLQWEQLQMELLQRFSGLEIHNPYEQLSTIKQSSSIHDYIDDFEYLLSLVPRLPESQSMGYFIGGLRDDVKKWVRLHRPQSRLDAMYLGSRQGCGRNAPTRFR